MTIKTIPIVGGLNPTRTFLLRVIKLSTGVDIQPSAIKVFSLYDRWASNEGKRSALLRAKAISQIALNYFMEQDNPCFPFIKTNGGFPSKLSELRKYKGSPEGMQAVLSLLNHWRNIKAPGIPDTSSITDDNIVDPMPSIALISDNVPITWNFAPEELKPSHHEIRTRMGPNGKAIKYSAIDWIALQEEGLTPFLDEYLRLANSSELADSFYSFGDQWERDEENNIYSGRLSVKQELGGKDRIFAMCDYWTQIALHPLHDRLASILKTIPSDGTFGQDKAALDVKQWTLEEEPLFSLDLKSATDRFPVAAIKAVIGKMTNIPFSDAWCNLISNRSFVFRKQKLKFSVGQPMGAYSSWPSFALAHHVVVMTAAKEAGIKDPQYRILGDDIVLKGELLATHYRKIMESLGVEFSISKSLSGVNRAEFAKRIFYKGHEITAVPMKLICKTLSDYRLSITLFNHLISKTTWKSKCWSDVPTFIKCMKGFSSPIHIEKARKILCVSKLMLRNTDPHLNDEVSGEQNLFSLVSAKEAKGINNLIRFKVVKENFQNHFNKLQQMLKLLDAMELPGTFFGGRLQHPLFSSIKILQSSQVRSRKNFDEYLILLSKSEDLIKVPQLETPDLETFRFSYQKKQIMEATVQLATYDSLAELQAARTIRPNTSPIEYMYLMDAM